MSEFVTAELYPELGLNARVDLSVQDHSAHGHTNAVSVTSSMVEASQKAVVNQVNTDLTNADSSSTALP